MSARRDAARMIANSMAQQAAIESAWRWMRRSKAPRIALSEIVARVQAKAPGASPAIIQSEIERRISRYRPRRARQEAAR